MLGIKKWTSLVVHYFAYFNTTVRDIRKNFCLYTTELFPEEHWLPIPWLNAFYFLASKPLYNRALPYLSNIILEFILVLIVLPGKWTFLFGGVEITEPKTTNLRSASHYWMAHWIKILNSSYILQGLCIYIIYILLFLDALPPDFLMATSLLSSLCPHSFYFHPFVLIYFSF